MELSDFKSKAIEDHVNQCIECRELLVNLSSTYKLIDVENKWKASPSFYPSLIEKKMKLKSIGKTSLAMKFIRPLAVAASISLGVIIGNGELDLLLDQNAELELTENMVLLSVEKYSMWSDLNTDDGN